MNVVGLRMRPRHQCAPDGGECGGCAVADGSRIHTSQICNKDAADLVAAAMSPTSAALSAASSLPGSPGWAEALSVLRAAALAALRDAEADLREGMVKSFSRVDHAPASVGAVMELVD